MADAPTGDLVNFEDDERLDKPDALRFQTFVLEALADSIGGLFGECSGVLGWPAFGTTPTSAITIGECMLVGIRRRTGSTHRARGPGVVHYNPASTYQSGSTTIDVSAYDAGNDLAYLWFARTEMLADIATRRKWNAGNEVSFNPNTTKRQRIIFGTSMDKTVAPDEDNDWYVFARIVSWDGSVPTIQPFHPFEPGNLAGSGGTNDSKIAKVMADPSIGGLVTPGVELSAAQYMDLFRRAILMLFDFDWTFTPSTGAVLTDGEIGILGMGVGGIGMKQAKARLDALEAQALVLMSGRVTTDASVASFANLTRRETPVDADARSGAGVFQLGLKSDGHPTVLVTPMRRTAGDFTGTAPSCQVQVSAGTGAGVNWIVTVKLWDNANAAADSDFYIVAFGALSA